MAGLHVGESGELHRRVDRLGAGTGVEDAGLGDRGERGDPLGKCVGRSVRERVEARVRLDRADLSGDRLADLTSSVADLAVPETRHGIDQLVAIGVPQQRSLAAGDRDETLAGGFGERMEEGTGHGSHSGRQQWASPIASSSMRKPEVTIPEETPPTELVIDDETVGDGDEAIAGKNVTVHYVGVSWSTGEQFDASWDRMEPFQFGLGRRQVIQGWDDGVQGMKVGGRRRLTIPPHMGYGSAGAGGVIAPNETLVFVVDLISVG